MKQIINYHDTLNLCSKFAEVKKGLKVVTVSTQDTSFVSETETESEIRNP